MARLRLGSFGENVEFKIATMDEFVGCDDLDFVELIDLDHSHRIRSYPMRTVNQFVCTGSRFFLAGPIPSLL
jgi:hypothetical protein